MSTPENPTVESNPLSHEQKVYVLAAAVVKVIEGLRSGSVTAKSMTIMDEDAEEWPIVTMEQFLWGELAKCGIKEAARNRAGEEGR